MTKKWTQEEDDAWDDEHDYCEEPQPCKVCGKPTTLVEYGFGPVCNECDAVNWGYTLPSDLVE